jgi:hypothetical protein
VTLGTLVWAVILVVLLTQQARLQEAGTGWWIGAAAVGVVSGGLGVIFLRWRRGRMDRPRA